MYRDHHQESSLEKPTTDRRRESPTDWNLTELGVAGAGGNEHTTTEYCGVACTPRQYPEWEI